MMQRHTLPIILLWAIYSQSEAKKVAIIGGGVSGTFAAKYLADYDANHLLNNENGKERDCLLDEIVVFDVSPPPVGFADDSDIAENSQHDQATTKSPAQSSSDPRPPNWQGSRVASITLKDGSVVELGASIIYEGNQLVVDMINGDPTRLKKGKPMGTGKNATKLVVTTNGNKKAPPRGFGIYHGQKEWLLKPPTTTFINNLPSFLQKAIMPLYLLWRYNLDYFRLKGAVNTAVRSFAAIYDVLNDTQHDVTYFDSPMDIWEAMGLKRLAGVSFHDFLDGLGLYRDESLELEGSGSGHSWWDWRRWIPGMVCMRSELVSAMTLNTYNQDLNQMNGLVGLVAYVPAGGAGELFSIEGGNQQLMESALYQSRDIYDSSNCNSSPRRIQRHQKKVTAVVASEDSITLYEDQETLGKFDVVILAAPLQQCRINFLIESPMGLDGAVLHNMPLGGVHENPDSEDEKDDVVTNEHGQHAFASPLPSSATAPYTSVVTTLVSNATLNATHFGLRDDEPWPRSILVSERGKLMEEITTLTILSIEQGLMKTFSSDVLDEEKRNTLFGQGHDVEYVQVWGGGENGKDGGATPSFAGGRNSESLPFLLYDGSKHWGKSDARGAGPALYYANAVESAVAAIEISAIGAKSTAKLVARRLGLIRPGKEGVKNDEL